MNTLAQLQHRFQQHVLNGDPQAALADVSGHMDIYIHAYQGRMRQALMANFPVLHRALGDEGFGALAQAYCTAHPSQQRSIRWMGDGLVAYLQDKPGLLPHPALLDIAGMDWAMRSAFDAADTPLLQLADLAKLPASTWPALPLRAVPSLQCLELQWGVQALWHALHADENAQTSEPEHAPHTMLVWRQQLECRWRTLDTSEGHALRLVLRSTCFAELCEFLQQAGDADAAQTAVRYLTAWVSDGLLHA